MVLNERNQDFLIFDTTSLVQSKHNVKANPIQQFNIKQAVTILFFVLAITGCKSRFLATAPASAYKDPVDKIREISTLSVPVEVSMLELENQLNLKIGKLIYEDKDLNDNGGDNLTLLVTKRLPIKLNMSGQVIGITVPVKIKSTFGYKIEKFGVKLEKFEDTEFDIDVHFSTRISLNPDWTLTTKTSANGFDWVKKPSLKIIGFEIPIAPIVESIVDEQQPEIARIIDKELKANLNLKQEVTTAWNLIQDPFLVNEEFETWLRVVPSVIEATQPTAKGGMARIGVGIKGYTESMIGQKPIVQQKIPLPALQLGNLSNEQFQIALNAEVTFPKARSMALQQMKDEVYEFNNGKYKIKVEDLDVYGQNEFVVIGTVLSGSLNGKVYFKGIPWYDPSSKKIKVKNLDFDLDTKNKLVKTANWLAHDKFLKMMAPYFEYSVSAQLDEGRKMIEENLAGNKVNQFIHLKGQLEQLEPEQIQVTPDGIRAIIKASGKISIRVGI